MKTGGQKPSDVAGTQREKMEDESTFLRWIPPVNLSHLYSCLSHRVATPVVVFAVP